LFVGAVYELSYLLTRGLWHLEVTSQLQSQHNTALWH